MYNSFRLLESRVHSLHARSVRPQASGSRGACTRGHLFHLGGGHGVGRAGGVVVGHRARHVRVRHVGARAGLRVVHHLLQDHEARLLVVLLVACNTNMCNYSYLTFKYTMNYYLGLNILFLDLDIILHNHKNINMYILFASVKIVIILLFTGPIFKISVCLNL